MREDQKKRQEETYLRRFRENFAGFPEGTILPNEQPDFLVETSRECVGVELREYHVREPSEGRGVTLNVLWRMDTLVSLVKAAGKGLRILP